MLTMMKSGELQDDTLISMTRLVVGFLVGGIPALIIGVIMGLNSTLRAMIDPLIAATYPIPKSSILPLALLVLGLGEASKIFMVAIGVFYPIAMNAMAGVREINKVYLDVGHNFKASRWDVFRTIALPGAMPMIMTGVKLGVGMGLVLIAIAEMVGAKSGLGYLIWNAWETFAVDQMYVGLFVIALIGKGSGALEIVGPPFFSGETASVEHALDRGADRQQASIVAWLAENRDAERRAVCLLAGRDCPTPARRPCRCIWQPRPSGRSAHRRRAWRGRRQCQPPG
jgi:ABC-type nitrate/sulfonate/bicarbonate transport system permease component